MKRFFKDESGVTAIEYGLIAGLVAVVIITALSTLGQHLSNMYQQITNTLSVHGLGDNTNAIV